MQYSIDDLVRLAKRDNNTIRPYLYVNPIQGKHIPSSPNKITEMCETLAMKVNDKYMTDSLYVIGFAETATGIASVISSYLNNVKYYQNTTREYKEDEEYIYFTESHSHARDQMLRLVDLDDCINNIERIVFVDDEVTTGETICNLIDVISNKYKSKKMKFTIVSLINSMTPSRIHELENIGIECVFLISLPFEYKKNKIINTPIKKELHSVANNNIVVDCDELCFESRFNPRKIIKFTDYIEENKQFSNLIKCKLITKHYESVLVLGTEEFMYPTICVGKMLEDEGIADSVRVHSTTRSPIIASDYYDYPLKHRYQIRSFYDADRITYIYNIKSYEKVLILTDATDYKNGLSDLCSILYNLDIKDILFARWIYTRD